MTSNNKEDYCYIEEEEVELHDSVTGFQTEWAEFGDIRMDVEPDSAQENGNKKRNAKNVPRKLKFIARKKLNTNSSPNKATSETIDDSSKAVSNQESEMKNLKSSAVLFDGNALFDGTFFTFIGEYFIQNGSSKRSIRKFKGKCELCENPTYIVGSGSSTFNFLRHLKRKHGQKSYDSYLSYKQVKSPNKIRPPRPKSLELVKKSTSSTTKISGTVTLYVADEYTWNQFGNPKNKRSLNSIILAENVSDRILKDVQDFLQNSAWYYDRSVPYRRTFLLHGPSGCGKSSFVFALASELNFGLCVLNANDKELTDSKLNLLLNTAPEKCIILVEDIDMVFYKSELGEQPSQLTLSGILNCLDGITASEGRILFLTCIDKDRLNPVLVRPGRVDLKEHFGFCSQKQIVQLFKKFYGGPTSFAEEFTQEVITRGKNVSPAQLQGFFLSNRHGDLQRLKLDVEHIWDF